MNFTLFSKKKIRIIGSLLTVAALTLSSLPLATADDSDVKSNLDNAAQDTSNAANQAGQDIHKGAQQGANQASRTVHKGKKKLKNTTHSTDSKMRNSAQDLKKDMNP